MNKKAIFTCLSILILMLVISISVSAFQIDNSYTVVSDYPSSLAITNIINVFQIQRECGFFPSDLEIISISYDNDLKFILMIASFKSTSVKTDSSANLRYYRDGSRGVIPLIWTSDGWDFPYKYNRNPNSSLGVYAAFHYYSAIQTTDTTSYSGFIGINPNSKIFGSSNVNSDSALTYWLEYRNRLINFDSAVSEAYSEGLATGQGEGYQVGLDHGYDEGYDIGYGKGYSDGEDRGYKEGQTEGYSEGYSEGESIGYSSGHQQGFDEGREIGINIGYETGYDDGYKRGEDIGHQTGYSEGYETGYESGFSVGYETGYQSGLNDGDVSEPLQIFTAYIFRFDENNSLQYFSYRDSLNIFSWIDYESRFDPTKPPYTFSVRLTESDLNNSSTQIELPFDFLSSPGNQDYSVSSFDPDFLTGYGKSLSLFVTTSRSYNNGYNVGLQDGADLLDGISDISAKPIAALRDALDFELFGVNVGLVVVALVSVIIVFAAYKFVKKIFPI